MKDAHVNEGDLDRVRNDRQRMQSVSWTICLCRREREKREESRGKRKEGEAQLSTARKEKRRESRKKQMHAFNEERPLFFNRPRANFQSRVHMNCQRGLENSCCIGARLRLSDSLSFNFFHTYVCCDVHWRETTSIHGDHIQPIHPSSALYPSSIHLPIPSAPSPASSPLLSILFSVVFRNVARNQDHSSSNWNLHALLCMHCMTNSVQLLWMLCYTILIRPNISGKLRIVILLHHGNLALFTEHLDRKAHQSNHTTSRRNLLPIQRENRDVEAEFF